MTKIGLLGISADLSRRFAPLYLPGLPLSGSSARIPKGESKVKIENGMALLFKILNRKCSCPLIENFRWKNSIKNWLRPLIFRNFLSKIFRKSKMGYAPHHLASQGASPRGEAAKRLTIFASLCASTMRQGEGLT